MFPPFQKLQTRGACLSSCLECLAPWAQDFSGDKDMSEMCFLRHLLGAGLPEVREEWGTGRGAMWPGELLSPLLHHVPASVG